ncbi:MAG: glycosyltransferase family 39 protein [Candidatus Margulisiibacteriota bacterium]
MSNTNNPKAETETSVGSSVKKSYLFYLMLLAAILFLFKLGSFSLYDAAETTYGEFVKNMIRYGDYLTLRFNGAIIFDKPPLYYWFVALLSRLIGFNEWAMRLPAAISGLLTVALTYFFGKKLFNSERAGFFAGLVTMTAFQFLVQSRIAELDVVLTLFVTLALFCFYRGYSSHKKWWFTLSYFPIALAFLLKGLLGVAMPAGTIFLFLLLKGELGKTKELKLPAGIVIFMLIGLPWYAIELFRHGKPFLDFTVGFLFLSRFQGVVAGHTGPWYYYFLAIILGFAPWSPFLPYAFWRTARNWRSDSSLLCLSLIVPTFIVFSAATTKLPSYILPLYPFFGLMVGKLLDDSLNDQGSMKIGMIISYLLLFVVVLMLIAGFIMAGNINYPDQYKSFLPLLYILAAVLAGTSFLAVVIYFAGKKRLSIYTLTALAFAIMFVLTLMVLPQVEELKGARPLGREIERLFQPGQRIAAFGTGNRPGVVFYSPRTVEFLKDKPAVWDFINNRRGYLFISMPEYEKIRFNLPKYVKILGVKGDLLVLQCQNQN